MSIHGSVTTPSAAALEAGKGLLSATLAALRALQDTWDPAAVEDWTREVVSRSGRVVLCGMGKSGLVGQKISATFASTGCPSFFLHPAEALHGDLGMVTAEDAVLLLSNSGETEEVLALLPSLLRLGVPIASITSRPESRMARASRWCFAYSLPEGEGCPLNFAPMASTTLQLAWGDLLNAYRMAYTAFTLEHFAKLHPAGNIGSRLLKVDELMHTDAPRIAVDAPFLDILHAMTAGRLGMTLVMEGTRMAGVISDGDIRRAVERTQADARSPLALRAQDFLTPRPVRVKVGTPAQEAARIMEERKITFVLVVDDEDAFAGVVHIHDLLQAKVI